MQTTFYYCQNEKLFLKLYIQPNAKQNSIVGRYDDRLKIKIKAPALDDKANRELIKFLAQYLEIPPRDICIVQGIHSRSKLVAITTISKKSSAKQQSIVAKLSMSR